MGTTSSKSGEGGDDDLFGPSSSPSFPGSFVSFFFFCLFVCVVLVHPFSFLFA